MITGYSGGDPLVVGKTISVRLIGCGYAARIGIRKTVTDETNKQNTDEHKTDAT